MTIETYRLLHIIGIIALFFGFGGVLFLNANHEKSKGQQKIPASLKIQSFVAHGVGLILILISGFGMLARLGYAHDIPGRIYAKLIIWILLGLGVSAARRLSKHTWKIFFALWALGGTAAALALLKL